MIGIVGLGNPGARYAGTRHNAGVDFARALARERGIRLCADKKLFAECGRSPNGDFWLATPDLFMNESGTAVAAIAQWCNIRPERILVAHDEIDLPLGVTRFKFGGSEAGHNGLRDITQKIGTRNYCRLRIGVGSPKRGREDIADYVLRQPPPAESEKIAAAIDRARTAMALFSFARCRCRGRYARHRGTVDGAVEGGGRVAQARAATALFLRDDDTEDDARAVAARLTAAAEAPAQWA